MIRSFLIFFFSWVALYKTGINTLPIQSEDVLPSVFLPVAIINEGTLNLDSYYDMLIEKYPHPDDKNQERGLTPFYLKKIEISSGETHFVSAFPLIAGLLAVPIYFVPLKLGLPITWENLTILLHVSSALMISLSGFFLYTLLFSHLNLSRSKSKLITFIYLFATINFSLLSQGLWQHGTVEFFSLLALLALFKKRWFSTGLWLGFAILSRPTAALLVPFFGLYALYLTTMHIKNRQFTHWFRKVSYYASKVFWFVSGFVPPALFFNWYTQKYYSGIGNNGYASQLYSWLSPFPEGFLGMWFSPSKGLLVYSPVLIFALVGLVLAFKNYRKENNLKYIFFGAIVLLHTLFLSIWKHWYGGYGFGYRMASDVLPFMVLLLVPYLKSSFYEKTKYVFFVTIALSVLMQIQGLIFYDSIWHAAYDKGFKNTSWLWSIKDSETAFNIRRILVKLGLMERACPQCL